MISKHKKPFVFSITCVLAVISGPTTGTTIFKAQEYSWCWNKYSKDIPFTARFQLVSIRETVLKLLVFNFKIISKKSYS